MNCNWEPFDDPAKEAAYAVIADLLDQGWRMLVAKDCIDVTPPSVRSSAEAEKQRVRSQELIKRKSW